MAAAGGSWKGGNFVPAQGGQDLEAIGKARYSSADRITRQYWENNRSGEAGYVANYLQQMRSIEQAAARYSASRKGGGT